MVLPSRLHTIETERRCGPITRLNANVRASSARFRRPGGRDGGRGRTRGFASVAYGRVTRGTPVAQRGFQRTRPGDGSGAHEERVSSLPGPLPAVRAPAPASARPRTHGGAGGTPPQSPAQRVLGGRARAVLGAMVALLEWRASLGKRAKGRQGASILGSRSAPRLSRSCPPVPFIPPRGETPRPAAQSETDVGPRDEPLGSVSGLGLGTLSCVKVKQPGYDAAGVLPVGGAACPPRCPAALWRGGRASPGRSRPPGGSRTVHPQHVAVLVSGAARTTPPPPRKGTGRKSHPRSIHCPWSFRWAGNVHTRFTRPTSPRPRARRGPHRHKTAGQCPRRTAHKSSTDTTARKPQTPDRADSFRGVSAVPHSQTSRLDSPENRQHPTRSARLQGAKSAFRNPAFLRANSNPTHSCVEKNKTPRSEAKRGGGRRAP